MKLPFHHVPGTSIYLETKTVICFVNLSALRYDQCVKNSPSKSPKFCESLTRNSQILISVAFEDFHIKISQDLFHNKFQVYWG